ncbi:MAG: molybdopterin-binding protein [Desulfosudis oleivorans]|nr:molybdopterin-binding protein [Desulfosudis oleivorans]
MTTGGTGLSPRDVTPDATLIGHRQARTGHGRGNAHRKPQKDPHAMISRAVVGVRKHTLIINIPGSPKAARECLESIAPALPHALDKLGGDMSECAQ